MNDIQKKKPVSLVDLLGQVQSLPQDRIVQHLDYFKSFLAMLDYIYEQYEKGATTVEFTFPSRGNVRMSENKLEEARALLTEIVFHDDNCEVMGEEMTKRVEKFLEEAK